MTPTEIEQKMKPLIKKLLDGSITLNEQAEYHHLAQTRRNNLIKLPSVGELRKDKQRFLNYK